MFGPEILQSSEIERKIGIITDTKIRKVKNVEVLYSNTKHTSAGAYMIRLPVSFVYILYSLLIVCMYKKHTKAISVT